MRELRVRADAGFGYHPVLDMLEARPAQYAVVARMTAGLKRKLGGLRYERCNPRWEIAELELRPHGWSQARRFIVARRRIEGTEPGADALQPEPLPVSGVGDQSAADASGRVALL